MNAMGRFVNPGNSAFKVALASEIYIDKTGLLDFTNRQKTLRNISTSMMLFISICSGY